MRRASSLSGLKHHLKFVKFLVEYFLNFTYYSISAKESDIFPGAGPREIQMAASKSYVDHHGHTGD